MTLGPAVVALGYLCTNSCCSPLATSVTSAASTSTNCLSISRNCLHFANRRKSGGKHSLIEGGSWGTNTFTWIKFNELDGEFIKTSLAGCKVGQNKSAKLLLTFWRLPMHKKKFRVATLPVKVFLNCVSSCAAFELSRWFSFCLCCCCCLCCCRLLSTLNFLGDAANFLRECLSLSPAFTANRITRSPVWVTDLWG